jgi:hypothetical protein
MRVCGQVDFVTLESVNGGNRESGHFQKPKLLVFVHLGELCVSKELEVWCGLPSKSIEVLMRCLQYL